MSTTNPVLPVDRLDRSRTFGTVYGPDEKKVRFRQSCMGLPDWPYDINGKLMENALDEQQRAKLKDKRAAAAKAPPVVLTEEDDAPLEAPPEPKIPEDEGLVNLELWLRGQAKYRFADVQKALRDRKHVDKMTKASLALYLIEELKLVPRDEVDPSILPPRPAAD